nr:hypothetical protein [Parasedimentitalea psychrophila]
MHRDWHEAPFDLPVTVGLNRAQRLGIAAEVQAFLLAAGGAKRACHPFYTPIAKQGLVQAQHAIAVLTLMMVKFFETDMHGLDLI